MPILADERLAALVRQVMPPRAQEWIVQVVDDHQDACVMFNRNVLRVHRNWSTAVHDAGLPSVLAYHPLSLKKVSSQVLRGLSSRTVVDVWQACTIKKGHNGRLTEKQGFLAWTAGGEFAFAVNAAAPELGPLRAARRVVYERARQARSRSQRDEDYQGLLSRRLTLRKYDGAFRVPLTDYERWLSNLVYQLDRDVQRAQTETDGRSLDQMLGRLAAELDAGRG